MQIAIAALVVAIVAFIALFVRSYNSGDNKSAGPTFGPITPTATPGDSGSGTSTVSPKPRRTVTGIPRGGVTNFTFPNGQTYRSGSNAFFRAQPQHLVVLRVTSGGNARLIRVGWLAPESYDAPYGDLKNLASPWTITLHSSGDKYHAALFVGTNSYNPVTCQISVDGKVMDTQTAQYPGSHQVCVG